MLLFHPDGELLHNETDEIFERETMSVARRPSNR